MILISIIILTLSSLVQCIASNFLGYTASNLSLFSTLHLLIALLVIKPYFENEKKYFILLIIFGMIMDIVYTNTLILNTCLFIIVYYFSKAFHFFFPYNFLTINISNLLGIWLYHLITFAFLSILQYDNYSIWLLTKVLSHSIIMTILYTSLIYSLVKFIYQKLQLKEVK